MTSKARDIADLGSNDVLETSSTGVDVTGTVTADGLTVEKENLSDLKTWANSDTGSIDFYQAASYPVANQYGRVLDVNAGSSNSVGGSTMRFLTAEGNLAGRQRLTIANNGDVSFFEDTGTTAKMVWDASAESLGIGTDSPSSKLDVVGAIDAESINVVKNQTSDTAIEVANVGTASASTTSSFILSESAGTPKGWFRRYRDGSARTSIGYDGNFTIEHTNGTERARIDSSGNLLVGTTTSSAKLTVVPQTAQAGIHLSQQGSASTCIVTNSTNANTDIIKFDWYGSKIGSITNSGGVSISYNTTSDERLKENIQDTTHSVDINDIQVREFDWKTDGSHQRYGFIAQELETVYPEAVHSPEDTDEMKSVDYSKLVPLLVKEIQTLKARIETLENN